MFYEHIGRWLSGTKFMFLILQYKIDKVLNRKIFLLDQNIIRIEGCQLLLSCFSNTKFVNISLYMYGQ